MEIMATDTETEETAMDPGSNSGEAATSRQGEVELRSGAFAFLKPLFRRRYAALALLAIGLLAGRSNHRWLGWSAGLFVLGVAIFSGCLYALVLSSMKILGAIVPLGGSCMIAGWILLAIAACKSRTE